MDSQKSIIVNAMTERVHQYTILKAVDSEPFITMRYNCTIEQSLWK